MALTAEDVVNKRFTITKFRDGYDLDQVDDFLDEVVAEFKRYEDQIAELTAEKERLSAELKQAKEAAAVASSQGASPAIAQAAALSTQTGAVTSEDAVKSSHMLQLAMELHDKHIFEGEQKRDQLISEAEQTAHQLVSAAQKKRAEDLEALAKESKKIEKHIEQLREFETEYRGTLTSYIQGQLRELEGSPEPDNYPVLK